MAQANQALETTSRYVIVGSQKKKKLQSTVLKREIYLFSDYWLSADGFNKKSGGPWDLASGQYGCRLITTRALQARHDEQSYYIMGQEDLRTARGNEVWWLPIGCADSRRSSPGKRAHPAAWDSHQPTFSSAV